MTTNIGYVYDPIMSKHECLDDPQHPENPERTKYIHQQLLQTGFYERMQRVPVRKASYSELALAHTDDYLKELEIGLNIDPDTYAQKYNSVFANQYTLDSARYAAGGVLDLTWQVCSGHLTSGFANIRPPGHHAHKNKPSGFCILNNVALAAIFANQQFEKRVAIIDWDIHVGDGTADIVQDRESILFISVHKYCGGSFWPGTGASKHDNNVHFIGLNEETAGDRHYQLVFDGKVIPQLRRFGPDLILVSAGFDAVQGDPLGKYKVSPKFYARVISNLKLICPNIILVLEGGYDLDSLGRSVVECVDALFYC
jgi:acetoin utilization deacetylase AcuC-like enzyme